VVVVVVVVFRLFWYWFFCSYNIVLLPNKFIYSPIWLE
jgi:hypothetical protein